MDEAWPDRIRRLRAFLAVSQVRFAAIFGTSVVSMNRWETGHATPSPFHSTIFVLLEYAVLVRPAAEMVRRSGEHLAGVFPRRLTGIALSPSFRASPARRGSPR